MAYIAGEKFVCLGRLLVLTIGAGAQIAPLKFKVLWKFLTSAERQGLDRFCRLAIKQPQCPSPLKLGHYF